jgi:hypothetical protein
MNERMKRIHLGSKSKGSLTIIPTSHQGRTSPTPTARPSAGSELSCLEIDGRGGRGRYRRSAQRSECQEGEEQHRGGRGEWWRHDGGGLERDDSCGDEEMMGSEVKMRRTNRYGCSRLETYLAS